MLAGIFRIVHLRAEARLAWLEAFRDRDGAHPDVDPVARDVGRPDALPAPMGGELAGEAEIASDRLAQTHAVQSRRQWECDRVRDRAVVLMARVDGRDEVLTVMEDRSDEVLDPFGRDRTQVRV